MAIELDKDLFDFLKKKYQNNKNIELIQGDCLKVNWQSKKNIPNKLIANIPYNITASIIFKMISLYPQFDSVILMMQEEVGERIMAEHNSKTYGILSVILQKFYQIEKIIKIPPKLFFPTPKVDSIVIKFRPKQKKINQKEILAYISFIKFAFNERRKIFFNRLNKNMEEIFKNMAQISSAKEFNHQKQISSEELSNYFFSKNISLKARPENLSIDQFWELFLFLSKFEKTDSNKN